MDHLKNRLLAANVVGLFVLAYAFMAGPGLAAPSQAFATATAPVGTAIAYQGRLVVADGAYDFLFRLWDAASAGTKIGPDVRLADAPVKATAYSVALNFGPTAFTGDARWLEVYYRPGASTGNYTRLARQPLLATAYAESLRPGATMIGAVACCGQAMLRADNTSTGVGLWGSATSNDGIYGLATTGKGVEGQSTSGAGVYGTSASGEGVHGEAHVSGRGGVVGVNTAGGEAVYGLSSSGRGVVGLTTSGTAGVYGENSLSNGSGVEGHANGNSAAGVFGVTTNGTGVWGRSGSGGAAMIADGNVRQSLGSGGWVKFMAFIDPFQASDRIKQCFNSQLPAVQATSGDCDLTMTYNGVGSYILDFRFPVRDRFISVTPVFTPGTNGDTSAIISFPDSTALTQRVFINMKYTSVNDINNFAKPGDSGFYIIVY